MFDTNLATNFLYCKTTGAILHSNFLDEKLFGFRSFLKKAKLPTVNIDVKSCSVNTLDGVANIKEEQKLMSCFIVTYRTWHHIDLLLL